MPSLARGASNSERLVLSARSTPERLLLSFCALFSPWICSSRAGWGQLPFLPVLPLTFLELAGSHLTACCLLAFLWKGGIC